MKKEKYKHKYVEGDIVSILKRDEILATLDSCGKHEGCLMMEQMWQYCGKSFKVIKVVNNFFDEYQYKMYKVRPPLYILEGLICDGIVESFEHRCDRSCYLLWHEEWLDKT